MILHGVNLHSDHVLPNNNSGASNKQPASSMQAAGKVISQTRCFKIESLLFNSDCHTNGQCFPTSPKQG